MTADLDRAALVEKMAEASWLVKAGINVPPWKDIRHEKSWEYQVLLFLDRAAAALAAYDAHIAECGMVSVPMEPTPEMLAAGGQFCFDGDTQDFERSLRDAAECWAEMLAAATAQKGTGT